MKIPQAIKSYKEYFNHVKHMPRKDLVKVYQHADVFVFPTLAEGMPLVILEAMASGLPVITTPNGPGDIVRNEIDGFLVAPRDIESIVEKVELLRTDHELRRWMSINARERAMNYTWGAYCKTAITHLRGWSN